MGFLHRIHGFFDWHSEPDLRISLEEFHNNIRLLLESIEEEKFFDDRKIDSYIEIIEDLKIVAINFELINTIPNFNKALENLKLAKKFYLEGNDKKFRLNIGLFKKSMKFVQRGILN